MNVIDLPEDNTMDIYSEKGTKVVFSGEGGWEKENKDALGILEVGKTYTVLYTRVGGWFSRVTLEEFPDLEFNTVMFNKI